MRLGLAIVVAGVAFAGADFLVSVHLGSYVTSIHTRYADPYGIATHRVRAPWQIPVAIVIAAVGLGAAIVVARSGSGDESG